MLKINKNITPVYEEDSNADIRSNVGEMILNMHQIKKLFDVLAKDKEDYPLAY